MELADVCTAFAIKTEEALGGPIHNRQVVSPVAFHLNLPPGRQIHPTFHANNLKVYIRHPEFKQEVEPPLEMCAGQNLQERERKETRSGLKKIFLLPIFFVFSLS